MLTGAFSMAAAQYVAALFGFLNTIYVSRLLGPEQYGLVALVAAYSALLWGVASLKSSSVTIRYMSRYREAGDFDKINVVCKIGYLIDVACGLIVTALIVATSGLYADNFLGKDYLRDYIIYTALVIPIFSLNGTSKSIIISFGCNKLYSLILIGEKILALVMSYLLIAIYGDNYKAVIFSQIGTQFFVGVFNFAIGYFVARKNGVNIFKSGFDGVSDIWGSTKKMFAWSYVLTGATSLMDALPVMMLGKFSSVECVGYYRLATNISNVFGYVEAGYRKIVYPKMAGDVKSLSNKEAIEGYRTIGRNIGGKLAVFSVVFGVAIYFTIPLMFGNNYYNSVAVALILLFGGGVTGYYFWVESMYFSAGKIKTWTINYMITNFFVILAIIIYFSLIDGGKFLDAIYMASAITFGKYFFYIKSSSGVDHEKK